MFRPDDHVQKDEDESEADKDENENENDEDDIETFRLTEIEPALEKVKLAMEKVNKLLNSTMLKCKNCDLNAKNQNGLNKHKKHGYKSPKLKFFQVFTTTTRWCEY